MPEQKKDFWDAIKDAFNTVKDGVDGVKNSVNEIELPTVKAKVDLDDKSKTVLIVVAVIGFVGSVLSFIGGFNSNRKR